MRQFAIIKDVSSDKLFAIIVKDDDFTVCHGVHAAGKKWAESYNKGLTKSIYDDLQPGISVGSFAPVRATTQALIDEATETARNSNPPPVDIAHIDVWADGSATWRN